MAHESAPEPTEVPTLDPVEQRVLGSLMEKQVTVPASYPLSLNGLQTACNQATSREPVTDYAASDIETVCRALKDRGLVRIVWAGAGSRVLKYHQRLEEALELAADEKAVLTVLLLRGEQTAGELKTRTDRLHKFAGREDVEIVLQRLAGRSLPLVQQLPRRPGQHDERWIHLLGPIAGLAPGAAAEPTVDRDVVVALGASARDEKVRAGYDAVASAYAAELGNELAGKPFDRWLLSHVADQAGGGPVADVGCGPGQTTAVLAAAGARVTGFDFSLAMLDEARALHPDVTFKAGDYTRLLRPPAASAWAAITAWYAFVHAAGSELVGIFSGLARVLQPGGVLAFCVHVGDEVRHVDELFGAATDLDFVLHDSQEVVDAVSAAGLVDVQWFLRSALPTEAQTPRLYVVARQPD